MANSIWGEKDNLFKVVVETGGQKFEAEGTTVNDTLNALEMDYTDVKVKGTITLTQGNLKAERFLYCRPLRRFVVSKLRKAQIARDLESMLA